jgi:hypothetical protein
MNPSSNQSLNWRCTLITNTKSGKTPLGIGQYKLRSLIYVPTTSVARHPSVSPTPHHWPRPPTDCRRVPPSRVCVVSHLRVTAPRPSKVISNHPLSRPMDILNTQGMVLPNFLHGFQGASQGKRSKQASEAASLQKRSISGLGSIPSLGSTFSLDSTPGLDSTSSLGSIFGLESISIRQLSN